MKLSDYYCFMPIYGCAKFRWKISKNKICHFWQAPLTATGPLWNIYLLLNGSHWNSKFSLTSKLDLRNTKPFHNRPSSFCCRYPNVWDRTKNMDYSWYYRLSPQRFWAGFDSVGPIPHVAERATLLNDSVISTDDHGFVLFYKSTNIVDGAKCPFYGSGGNSLGNGPWVNSAKY
jgi:hypothetical protein